MKRFLENLKFISIKIILFLLIFSILSAFTLPSVYANVPSLTDISTRNLAMFASIAYADLENISNYNIKKDNNINNLTFASNKMVSDDQLKSITTDTVLFGINLSGKTEDTYTYLFYNLASTTEVINWEIVNYAKIQTTVFKGTAEFTAMTFKRDNNIVISYRGTDFNDAGDWIQDISYGIVGYAGQEDIAQKYALKVAKHYPNCNIYVTGHSLGGYLAQIGGAALIQNGYESNIKEIGYFNGMGLFFLSNINSKINQKLNITKNRYQSLVNTFNITQSKAKQSLTSWYNNGGKLVSYRINGDIISAIGQHCGDVESFNAYYDCISHHNGNSNSKFRIKLVEKTLKALGFVFNNDIYKYVHQYKPNSFLDYVWITHETDSFFGILDDKSITASISSESKVKLRKTQKFELKVTTTNAKLASTSLSISDFETENKRIKINKIRYLNYKDNGNNSYTYTYEIEVKGLLLGTSSFYLKANTLRAINTQSQSNIDKTQSIANSVVSSNTFRVTI